MSEEKFPESTMERIGWEPPQIPEELPAALLPQPPARFITVTFATALENPGEGSLTMAHGVRSTLRTTSGKLWLNSSHCI